MRVNMFAVFVYETWFERCHMFFRWCGGCGSKKEGLMNMLEAQNTLVYIIHPSVVSSNLTNLTFEGSLSFKDCRKD